MIVALAIIGALAVLLVCAVIADIFDCWPPVKGLARLKGATVEAIKQEGRE